MDPTTAQHVGTSIIDNDVVRKLSDHGPLYLEIRESAMRPVSKSAPDCSHERIGGGQVEKAAIASSGFAACSLP